MSRKPLKYTQTTNLTTVKAVADLIDASLVSSGSILPSVTHVVVQAEAQAVRWRDDTTAPTGTVGHLLLAGQSVLVERDRFAFFQCIDGAVAGAIANVTAYSGTPPAYLPPGQTAVAVSGSVTATITPTPANGVGYAQPASKAVAVTTSGAYAEGDGVGGIISVTTVNYATGRRVTLRSIQINDKDGNSLPLDLYFFKATPAAGTYTDNAALAWGTGDSANKVGQLKVAAGDWVKDGGQSAVNFGLTLKMPVAATTLFLLIVCPTGSAPTFTNGGLTINMEFDQE